MLQLEEKYGKTPEELRKLCLTLSEVIDVNKDGKVTWEEWRNWIKSSGGEVRNSNRVEGTTPTEIFFHEHSKYAAWQNFFFKLSKGEMKIELDNFVNHVEGANDFEVHM